MSRDSGSNAKKNIKQLHRTQETGLDNIIMISKISKYRKYHDIVYIFDILDTLQKMKILNKLYNNRCNTLMQYLLFNDYYLYHTLKLRF